MTNMWQVYEKRGSRWITIGDPMAKVFAEAIVVSKWALIEAYENTVATLKKANAPVKSYPPEPGFREPHCVPV